MNLDNKKRPRTFFASQELEGVKITKKAYAVNPDGQVFTTEDIFADPIKWIELFGDAREEALEELDALEKES